MITESSRCAQIGAGWARYSANRYDAQRFRRSGDVEGDRVRQELHPKRFHLKGLLGQDLMMWCLRT
jgi:hypothetical protein